MFSFLPFTHFQLGPFTFYTWGFVQALTFLAAFFWTLYQAPKIGLAKEKIYFLAVLIIFSSLIFARFFYVFFNWPYFWENPLKILRLDEGGLVFYGGFLGFVLAVVFWVKYYARQIKLGQFLDLLTPVIFLAIF